jgi:hypothetical protein
MTHQRQSRFTNNNLPQLQEANHKAIIDYEDLPLLTLEEAVEKIIPLISNVMDYVATAKKKYNWHSTLLTRDESAAIYLYTMSTPFATGLNATLRSDNRRVPEPWVPFLKLFIAAVKKLPVTKATVWRGINYDAALTFVAGEVYTWWNITSCSMNNNIAQKYLDKSGTLFLIEITQGRDISMFSAFPDEQEVILMPGTRVRAKNPSLNPIEQHFIIHLEEIAPQR